MREMHKFNKPMTCSKCESDQYQLFVDLEGNGVKCLDCLHKKHVFKSKKSESKGAKRKRMRESWQALNKQERF